MAAARRCEALRPAAATGSRSCSGPRPSEAGRAARRRRCRRGRGRRRLGRGHGCLAARRAARRSAAPTDDAVAGLAGRPARRRRRRSSPGVRRGRSTGRGDLARAAYDGVPGHPVLLGRDHWAGVVGRRRGDRGARDYLAAHDVDLVECGDLATGARRRPPPMTPAVPTPTCDRGRLSAVTSAIGRTAMDLLPPTSPPGSGATGYLVRRRAGDRHLPRRSRCSARCCSRASPAPARPRWPRRSPRAWTCRWSGCSATRASTPRQALYDWDFPRQILHLRALEAGGGASTPRRPRRACTTSASCSRARCWPRCSRPRRCCSSTRSTAPTTSSRRSCSRCSRPGR